MSQLQMKVAFILAHSAGHEWALDVCSLFSQPHPSLDATLASPSFAAWATLGVPQADEGDLPHQTDSICRDGDDCIVFSPSRTAGGPTRCSLSWCVDSDGEIALLYAAYVEDDMYSRMTEVSIRPDVAVFSDRIVRGAPPLSSDLGHPTVDMVGEGHDPAAGLAHLSALTALLHSLPSEYSLGKEFLLGHITKVAHPLLVGALLASSEHFILLIEKNIKVIGDTGRELFNDFSDLLKCGELSAPDRDLTNKVLGRLRHLRGGLNDAFAYEEKQQ